MRAEMKSSVVCTASVFSIVAHMRAKIVSLGAGEFGTVYASYRACRTRMHACT